MSRHEGVSCDSCLKSNFRGRRYKCLICYDYDLCASCYEEGATSTRHSTDHPMQCILTRTDFDVFYGGESYGTDLPQSFTCPYCKKMGFSDATLIDHVSAEHIDTGLEVVCPVCASVPGGDPNLITDDFAGHLSLEHRTQARGDLISFLHLHDEPSSIRHGGVRRIPHTAGNSGGRALGGPRSRRSNMHFSSAGTLSALSPAGRDSVDPISELLSQLTGVRRGAPQPSQLHQLQMQIQLERQQVPTGRQNLERLPRRQAHPIASTSSASVVGGVGPTMAAVVAGSAIAQAQLQQQHQVATSSSGMSAREISITSNPMQMAMAAAAAAAAASTSTVGAAAGESSSGAQSMYLLNRIMTSTLPDAERSEMERSRADRSQYVQGLLLSTMSQLHLGELEEETEAKPLEVEQTTEADRRRLDEQNEATNEQLEADEEEQQQQQQQQLNRDMQESMPPQHYVAHYGRGGGGLLDSAAAAKLKTAASAGGGGKPPMPGAQQRPTAGRQPQQQPQPQSQKSRELKASAVAAKESNDSSR